MTLITNLVDKSHMILASDKRVTHVSPDGRDKISEDNVLKLFRGENYCAGIQGNTKTKTDNYSLRLEAFVKEHPVFNQESAKAAFDFFSKVKDDPEVAELNLTISGVSDGKFVSVHLDLKNSIEENCLNDPYSIRFNRGNSPEDQLFRQAMIFLTQYLRGVKLFEKFSNPPMPQFKLEDQMKALQSMYERFHNNDMAYYLIGGKINYCIIYLDGKMDCDF